MSTRSVRLSRSGIARRIVSLPMHIFGGVSRAVGHGISSMIGSGDRGGRSEQQQDPHVHVHVHSHEALLMANNNSNNLPEEWAFITSLEQHYGFSHPFFYACRFVEAMKMAEEESKPLFIYLHQPDHPHTAPFCTQTLASDLVVQFLDANFVSWGAIANRGEGFHMTTALRVPNFPFCAIIMPLSASGENNIAVLQQVEGPVSPAQLVEILQRTIEEQGSAFRATRAADEERRMANRLLREEQDAAYHAALQLDREKERGKESTAINITGEAECQSGKRVQIPKACSPPAKHPTMKAKQTAREAKRKEATTTHGKDDAMVTQIQIRFPNGERKEQSFLCTDKIQSIYGLIDSLDLPGMASYRLISNFPRKVYGFEQMGMSLKDAGLHPRASLFIELV